VNVRLELCGQPVDVGDDRLRRKRRVEQIGGAREKPVEKHRVFQQPSQQERVASARARVIVLQQSFDHVIGDLAVQGCPKA
jgi:hypothetical protein